MRNRTIFLVLAYGLFFFSGCKSETEEPILSLISGSGFFSSDTIADPGQRFFIRIKGSSGSSPATNIRIIVESNGTTGTILDSGIYTDHFDIVKSFYFGGIDLEKWSIYIKNKEGLVTSASISIRRNPNAMYGPISEYANLSLNLQQNNGGNMLIFKTGEIIAAPQSVSYQTMVDFLSYYSSINFYTLSSPNETEAPGFYPSILSMTTKNEVRYKSEDSSITSDAFDRVLNDSLLLASYDNSVIGTRKAKNVQIGRVIPFAVQTGPMAGKKGLIKIIDTQGEALGTIKLSIKIQH